MKTDLKNNCSCRTVSVVGKYLILLLYPNGILIENHLYYADLEKHGEITGKIPFNPVYTADLSSEFKVSKY